MAQEQVPDLLLLDFVLPDMRGIEFCKKLMSIPSISHLPILLISGKSDAIRQLYQDIPNIVDYLTKPFEINVIRAVVDHIFRKADANLLTQGEEGV